MRRLISGFTCSPNYTVFSATTPAPTPNQPAYVSWLCPSPLSGHHNMHRMHINHLALHMHNPVLGSPKVSGQNPEQFGWYSLALCGTFQCGPKAIETHHSTIAVHAWQHA
mmetsp:Transcript_25642/g.46286  ORF Transcript_25642/g.46286 Transcript_25642/m.46286 type:complete len:110 (+) Transcript_25642:4265-4594(+)